MAVGTELRSGRGVSTVGLDMLRTARLAELADRRGVRSVWTSETYARSGLVSLAAMASATKQCTLGSSILHGVGRTPVVLAADSLAVDELSGGRLVLGLGNGTRKMLSDWFGADPDAPALRMEELVPLVRRLWRLHEGPVHHHGRFYKVDLIPTGDLPVPLRTTIPVLTAGINPRMIQVAGRVSDGLIGHPLFGRRYLQDVVRPNIAIGAEHGHRDPKQITLVSMVICSVHPDEEKARREAAAQIALYATVKTYNRPLEVAGFAREAAEIRTAFARRDLPAMVAAVSDEMIDELAVAGTSAHVRHGLRRYVNLLDHMILYAPSVNLEPDRVEESIRFLIQLAEEDQSDHRSTG